MIGAQAMGVRGACRPSSPTSATMVAFHEPPRRGDRAGHVVGKDRGQRDSRHHSQPLTPKIAAGVIAARAGIAEAPAITLNRMYHWVPSIISGD